MKGSLLIYRTAIKLSYARRMAYRGDFILSTCIMLAAELLGPIVIFLIYRTGAAFPGWSLFEVLLIQGVFLTIKGIAYLFFVGMIGTILQHVREGTFDTLLIKPRSILFLSMIDSISVEDLGVSLGGIGLSVIALINLPDISFINWITFVLLCINSLMVFFAFSLLMSATLFRWVGNSRMYEIMESLMTFAVYPRSIFSRPFQAVITVIIPVAMVAFIPAAVLLGKQPDGVFLSCMSCFFFLFLSAFIWHRMLRHYTSAGG
jgi:ABC-2 type transport system permease protein